MAAGAMFLIDWKKMHLRKLLVVDLFCDSGTITAILVS